MSDLYAKLVEGVTAPMTAWLHAAGVEEAPFWGPPTRAGAGDLALACHRYARALRKAPQMIATDLAAVALAHPLIASAEPTAGFLNLRFDWAALAEQLLPWALQDPGALGFNDSLAGQRVMIEYSSPNTNKPQHLGHCRNNILGATVARLLKRAGAEVIQVNLINDRGIHICKSMLAQQRFSPETTPEGEGKKGDHFVGDRYVAFDKAFEAEYAQKAAGQDKVAFFNSEASDYGSAARAMLRAWEAEEPKVRALWRQMNAWCEAGFFATYARMGVHFDRVDRESQTYLLGKDMVEEGLKAGVFYHAENGAAVFDLTRIGLEGEKAVLRADGTSVYTTQDLGTALKRYEETRFDKMIYVVGNEQDHHFRVLFGILGALRSELEGKLYHLSYGMVELPEGKMKSREGKVVDADNLMDELHEAAYLQTKEKNLESGAALDEAELHRRAEAIGLAGLKFYLLKFAPATTFLFNPAESIQPNGETGVYCQYAYARGGSILRRLGEAGNVASAEDFSALVQPQAIEVLKALLMFPGEIRAAAEQLKPSLLAQATYSLAYAFASFYNHNDNNVLRAEGQAQRARVMLVKAARRVLGAGLELMGIEALEEM
ncbi:arginine--tRNA ligase [Myxococcota bacterium]|nr:arginine--tRNA ligase [Myxococcota bacterium]